MPSTIGKYGGKDSMMPSGQQKIASTEDQEEAAQQLFAIGKDLFESTRGLRGEGIGDLEDFLKGGRIPDSLGLPMDEMYREGRENMEDQYSVAREQLLDSTPSEGGQLNDQLGDLSTSRARSVGGLETQLKMQYEMPLRQALFGQALGIGFGQPPVAISGLSSAGGQYGQIAGRAQAEQLEREARAKEELGQIGQMAGMFFT